MYSFKFFKMRFFITLFGALIYMSCVGQRFEKSDDIVKNRKVVKYFDRNHQIILQKSKLNSGIDSVFYELGLYVFQTNFFLDNFMKAGAVIVFEDNSKIFLNEQLNFVFVSSGKYQISILHKLDNGEFHALKSKKIKQFTVLDINKTLDKWETENMLQGAVKLESESF